MFSERLKALRNEKGISQKELASVLFVSQQSIAKWETDRATPNPEMLSKIAQYFKVSSDYLLGLSSNKEGVSAQIVDDDLIVLMSRGGDKKVIKLTPEKKEKVKKAFELVFDDDEDIDF